jgi:para-aminobenzoate synthetase component 1
MLPPGTRLNYRFDPLEALRRWPIGRPVVLLHSGRLEPRWSRYSLLAEPTGALRFSAGRSVWIGDRTAKLPPFRDDPFLDFEAVAAADDSVWVGHLNYDLARHLETLPPSARDDHGFPDLQWHRCPDGLIYDHLNRTWSAFGYPAALPDLSRPPREPLPTFCASQVTPDRARNEHEAAVRRALRYIAAGDVFQVNLAHRFTGRFEGSSRAQFLALAQRSPAWYGAYLELLEPDGPRKLALASTSPELFLQLDADGSVRTRPIKGTLPSERDAAELLASAKDTAELTMIIDLLRNDLGRVCAYGSVAIEQPRTIESHPSVHHGVATVRGRLHTSRSLRHLLRATFPGGSITGAPKVRAMQIIEDLEPVRRGPYCGAIGWVQRRGDGWAMQLNLAIRTLLIDAARRQVRFSVGGGIVADSQPAAEYDETLHKARVLIESLGHAHAHAFAETAGSARRD